MFDNLRAEMARHHITNNDLTKALGFKSDKTLNNKLSGKTDFTRKEMFIIKSKFFPEYDLDYLFKEYENNVTSEES